MIEFAFRFFFKILILNFLIFLNVKISVEKEVDFRILQAEDAPTRVIEFLKEVDGNDYPAF